MKRRTVFFLLAGVAIIALGGIGKEGVRKAYNFAHHSYETATVSTNDRNIALDKLEGSGAAVIDAKTGDTLFYKNDRKRMYPASTTKIVTALVALETGKLSDMVTTGPEVDDKEPDESTAWLSQGQKLSLFDLLEAMMLPSGNDAARTIAVYIGRKTAGNPTLDRRQATDRFVGLMNERAKKAGAEHTNFVNPNGLHDKRQVTTVGDMAKIAREAFKNDSFRHIVGAPTYTAHLVSGGQPLTYKNTNLLLQKDSGRYYNGIVGGKTGYTSEAGYCLISAAERGGRSVISVVLDSTNEGVWSDSTRLLDYGFDKLVEKA